jgi:hypothetical protein
MFQLTVSKVYGELASASLHRNVVRGVINPNVRRQGASAALDDSAPHLADGAILQYLPDLLQPGVCAQLLAHGRLGARLRRQGRELLGLGRRRAERPLDQDVLACGQKGPCDLLVALHIDRHGDEVNVRGRGQRLDVKGSHGRRQLVEVNGALRGFGTGIADADQLVLWRGQDGLHVRQYAPVSNTCRRVGVRSEADKYNADRGHYGRYRGS